jgi:hypothetical protein
MPVAAVVRLSEQLMATHPGEMISELTLAIFNKVPLEVLAERVHCCPTHQQVSLQVRLSGVKGRAGLSHKRGGSLGLPLAFRRQQPCRQAHG